MELREIVARAMRETAIDNGEGDQYCLLDLLGFSGENQAHIVVNALANAAIDAMWPVMREMCAGVADAQAADASETGNASRGAAAQEIAENIRSLEQPK